jgi:hypothetical protein
MDFSTFALILGSLVFSWSFGFSIGLGARPSLKSRISEFAHQVIGEEINNFLKELHENPKFVSELTDPIIDSVSKKFGVENVQTGKARTMNILGFKVPQEIAMAGLNLLTNNRRTRNVTPGLAENALDLLQQG